MCFKIIIFLGDTCKLNFSKNGYVKSGTSQALMTCLVKASLKRTVSTHHGFHYALPSIAFGRAYELKVGYQYYAL